MDHLSWQCFIPNKKITFFPKTLETTTTFSQGRGFSSNLYPRGPKDSPVKSLDDLYLESSSPGQREPHRKNTTLSFACQRLREPPRCGHLGTSQCSTRGRRPPLDAPSLDGGGGVGRRHGCHWHAQWVGTSHALRMPAGGRQSYLLLQPLLLPAIRPIP